jgi:hypothetical protein
MTTQTFSDDHPIVDHCYDFYAAKGDIPESRMPFARYATRSELRVASEWNTPCGKAARRILSDTPEIAYSVGSSDAFRLGA